MIKGPMAHSISDSSTATTHGVRVDVRCRYHEHQSQPVGRRFAFAYRVRIVNESDVAVQLLSRRWIISDSNGKVKEITGAGVVGEQPIIHPGEIYTYESSAMLEASKSTWPRWKRRMPSTKAWIWGRAMMPPPCNS